MCNICLNGVSYSYPLGEGRSLKALKNLTFSVKDGEFVALVGKNGSGKSTLAKLLDGLFLPSSGDVTVDDINTRDNGRIFEIRKKVGVVFQNPDNQTVATLVCDDVAFGPENLGVPRDELVKRVGDALEAVGMAGEGERTVSKLSGGQKQRVAIAGVLAMQPEVLVLDESTSMLDPVGRKEIMKIAGELNEKGITIINITHNMDEAAVAKRIIVLKNGRVVMDGTPKEVFASAVVEDAGLALPPAAATAEILKEQGFVFDTMPLDGQELAEDICLQLK